MAVKTQNLSFGTSTKTQNLSFGTEVSTNNLSIEGSSAFVDVFTTSWRTTNSGVSDSNQITLPLISGNTYNFVADWGDGNLEIVTSDSITHTYDSSGDYTVRIQDLSGSGFTWQFNNGGDKEKLLNISQCGCLDISTSESFYGCSNMTWTATDAPSISTTVLYRLFRNCSVFNGNISNWNITGVTSTSQMFQNAFLFNQDLSSWDMSIVTNISNMLRSTSFDQDLSNWNITSVTNGINFLANVTLSTANYDAILNSWSQQAVQDNVTISFGNSVWTSSVQNIGYYEELTDTHSWTITDGGFTMPDNAEPFIADVLTTNSGDSASDSIILPRAATQTEKLYVEWESGDTEIIPNTTQNLTHTYSASGAKTIKINTSGRFEQLRYNNLSDKLKLTDVSQCGCLDISTTATFFGCSNMTWTATDAPSISTNDLTTTFRSCTNFNGYIGNWDMSNVTVINLMLSLCSVFDQDLSSWNISNVTAASNFLNLVTLSTANYDAILSSWSQQAVQDNVTISFGNSQYTLGSTAEQRRSELISDHSWTITDAGASGAETEYNALIAQASADVVGHCYGIAATSLNTAIADMKTAGIWAKLDILRCYATNGEKAFGFYNLKSPSTFLATEVNTLTFTEFQGLAGNGTDSYLDWNWSPYNDGVNYTINNGSLFLYNRSSTTNGAVDLAVKISNSNSFILLQLRNGADNFSATLNATNNSTSERIQLTNADAKGFYLLNRDSSTNINAYKDGVLFGQDTTAAAELNASANTMFEFSQNNGGSPNTYATSQHAWAGAGADLTAEQNEFAYIVETYMDAIGAGVVTNEAETTALLAEATTQGDTAASGKELYALNAYIKGLTDKGIKAKLDRLFVFATNGDSNFALYDILNPANKGTAVNSPTFTALQGFTGDNVSAYIDSNYTPSIDAVNMTQSDISAFVYSRNFLYQSLDPDLGVDDGSNDFLIGVYPTTYYNRTNDAGGIKSGAFDVGLILTARDGNNLKTYNNGTLFVNETQNYAVGLPSNPINFLKWSTSYSGNQVSIGGFGASLDATEQLDFYNLTQAYMSALGTAV